MCLILIEYLIIYIRSNTCVDIIKKEERFALKEKLGQNELLILIPSAYANMAASKYCKDPNYGKKK